MATSGNVQPHRAIHVVNDVMYLTLGKVHE